jgi:antitoxin (DNA-binding transcriptional repressor) of toxin-antitoxin stability system
LTKLSFLVEGIAISKFKATCLAELERVRQTGQPVRITRFGKPVADIVPPAPPKNSGDWLGCMGEQPRWSGRRHARPWDPEITVREWDELERIGDVIGGRNLAEEAARSHKRGKA